MHFALENDGWNCTFECEVHVSASSGAPSRGSSLPGPAVAEIMRTTAQRLAQLYRMPLRGVADGARNIPALRRRILGEER